MTKAKKPKKPVRKAWWKFWAAQEVQPPKAIAFDRTATEAGTTRVIDHWHDPAIDQARKSQDYDQARKSQD